MKGETDVKGEIAKVEVEIAYVKGKIAKVEVEIAEEKDAERKVNKAE